MADQKPPKVVADEKATLLALLQYQRDSVLRKVKGLDEETARRRLVPSDTTLLWLVRHLTGAESLWFLHRFAGELVELADPSAPDATLAESIAAYQATWARCDAVIERSDLDDMATDPDGDALVPMRWILMHLLEETARHAGHADILRELIDGSTGR